MKNNLCQRFILSLVAAACAFLTAHADAAVDYHVTVNTASLVGNPGAPFALDFQLNGDGGAGLSNFATISNFSFGGGSASANPGATTFGLAVGSLGSSISLTTDAANAFNEFYQGFTPGSTLSFDLSLSTNVNGPTPDGFSFAILDSSLANIGTTNFANALLLIDITSASPLAQTFSSTSPSGVTVSVSPIAPVPEPGTALFGFAIVGACGVLRRRLL